MPLQRLGIAVLVACSLVMAACSGDDDDNTSSSPDTEATTTTTFSTVHRLDDTLRLNQMQVLASHNSYKGALYPQVLATLQSTVPEIAAGLEYSHRPLTEQFDDFGIRAIELDAWADPQGGLYAQPAGPLSVGVTIPDDPAMRAPGFKVLHQSNVDTNSTCLTLVACMELVRDWSDAHPGHAPMMVQIEVKDEAADAAEFDALDAEIRSVFDDDQLITPDDVRGDAATLGEAVRSNGWPTLGETRGKVLFTLDNGGLRDVYLAGHPSLEGRVMFTPSEPGADDAAFAKLNDPVGDKDAIAAALAANMIVRTRADADTVQARNNDTTDRDVALASGAQFVSTD
ncbi:MAG TPA: Ca2+-dependent phosphoinositide-specific phospholipase C, partial [Acidimicrobiia bacterium]|nr:Ca2+-dependent phosphoinositide-specific phospholipase C [Acidimicrobiia bacterium]